MSAVLCLLMVCGACSDGDNGQSNNAAARGGRGAGTAAPTAEGAESTPTPSREKQAIIDSIEKNLTQVKSEHEHAKNELEANQITKAAQRYQALTDDQVQFLTRLKQGVTQLKVEPVTSSSLTTKPVGTLPLVNLSLPALLAVGVLLPLVNIAMLALLSFLFWKWMQKAIKTSDDNYFKLKVQLEELNPQPLESFTTTPGAHDLGKFKNLIDQLQAYVGILNRQPKKETGEDTPTTVTPVVQPHGPRTLYPTQPQPARTVPRDYEDSFPIPAEEYLSKMRVMASIAKMDFADNTLVLDPTGEGEWVLIEDKEINGGIFYAIPRETYMQAKQDFLVYFNKYYDCSKIQRGQVWIIQPAVVSKVKDGWRLAEKGVLEMR